MRKNLEFTPNSHSVVALNSSFITYFFSHFSSHPLIHLWVYCTHILYFPIHAPSLYHSRLHVISRHVFSFLFEKRVPWVENPLILFVCPISCSSSLPSFTVFLSFLLSIVGYRCCLCLCLKDYLCSHVDGGFSKGSLRTSSFRGPRHGRIVHEGGRVCAFVCMYLY